MRSAYALSKPVNQDCPKNWRDFLPVHPAAELFPLLDKDELRELADDIAKHGLQEQIDIYDDPEIGTCVLDGRNRLDALQLIGRQTCDASGHPTIAIYKRRSRGKAFDPVAYVLSKNIHRRHLTGEQRRDLIGKLLRAKPETSNLQIAKQVKADDKTVAKVRTELESRSEIPNVKRRTDTKGRKQSATKKRATEKVARSLNGSAPPPGIGTTAPKPDPFAVSAKALAEFKYACDHWLPKMVPEHRSVAIELVADLGVAMTAQHPEGE